MKRLAKLEGEGNVVLEEASVPEISSTEVLIRAECSQISRGSEIWRRYSRREAVDHRIMGYSMVGTIVQVGAQVRDLSMGERVAALAPHAEYVSVEVTNSKNVPSVVSLPDSISSEAGTFWPLGTSSVMWMWEVDPQPDDTLVILGQGQVGSGCMQAAKANSEARVIVVDALDLRCDLAGELGADEVVNISEEDPVEAIKRLTDGRGAKIVVEAVGGRAGVGAFDQALDMTRAGGLIQVIGLYEEEPLPLHSGKIQGKRLVGGYLDRSKRTEGSDQSLQLLADKKIHAEKMISHRFQFDDAPEAFDLLYNRLGETMGVLLVWQA